MNSAEQNHATLFDMTEFEKPDAPRTKKVPVKAHERVIDLDKRERNRQQRAEQSRAKTRAVAVDAQERVKTIVDIQDEANFEHCFREALRLTCIVTREFTLDDVLVTYHELVLRTAALTQYPHTFLFTRVGNIMKSASKNLCESTGTFVKSKDKRKKSKPTTLWRSLIFKEQHERTADSE
jgi:hypothetical protein